MRGICGANRSDRALIRSMGLQLQTHAKPKARSAALRALKTGRTTHRLCQCAHQRKSEPGAPILAGDGTIGLRKALEQAPLLVYGNTNAAVGNGEFKQNRTGILTDFAGFDPNDPVLAELDCIADEIGEHLPQAAVVPQAVPRCPDPVARYRQAFSLCRLCKQADSLPHDLLGVQRGRFQRQVA